MLNVGAGALFITITLGRGGASDSSSALPTTFGLTNTGGEGDVREVFGYVPAVQSGEYRIERVDLSLNGHSQDVPGEVFASVAPVTVRSPEQPSMPSVVSITHKPS